MASKRDDFKESTKNIMAKRVGYHRSNLSCRKPTCGVSDDPNNYSNIGVAAHIRAAARGGKRYNLDISNVIDILTAIRRRLSIAAKDGSYYQHRNGHDIIYEFHDPQLEMWLNSSREEILRIMSTICKDIGVPNFASLGIGFLGNTKRVLADSPLFDIKHPFASLPV